MKKFILCIFVCLVFAGILGSCKSEPPPKSATKSIYDTALLMLHEFIAESNDTNLGFKNADEVLSARLDTSAGLRMIILGKGIKLAEAKDTEELDLHKEMQKLHRIVYPVFVGNVLHSAITFDSSYAGWRPVMFDDSNIIAAYATELRKHASEPAGTRSYASAMVPDIHCQVTIMTDSSGEFILPTKELELEMGTDYPNIGKSQEFAPIPKKIFINALKEHIKSKWARLNTTPKS